MTYRRKVLARAAGAALLIAGVFMLATVAEQAPGSGESQSAKPAARSAVERPPAETSKAAAKAVLQAYAQIPLAFIPNAGQLDRRVRFHAQAGGSAFYFTPQEAVFSFVEVASPATGGVVRPAAAVRDEARATRGAMLALRFLGANPNVALQGQDGGRGRVNYLVGNDPSKWVTGLESYSTVVYRELWPGIDMAVRGGEGRLKYEFVVQPGARVEDIRLAWQGAERLSLDAAGNLRIATPVGVLEDSRPVSYQDIEGSRVVVDSRWVLSGSAEDRSLGFAVASGYDAARPLVIDPELVYSKLLGGSAVDFGSDVVVDGSGIAYVMGATSSRDFPTTPGAFDGTFNGEAESRDVFIAKLNAAGTDLLYSTFLGGANDEFGNDLVVNAAGQVFVVGQTRSIDFPTTGGAFDRELGGEVDAFVSKLDVSGSALLYSTFIGGTDFEVGNGLDVDAAGSVYLTGATGSGDFPTTTGAFDRNLAGEFDAFVTKLAASGASLLYSTYLGGTGETGDPRLHSSPSDVGSRIAVDATGRAYVAGITTTFDFPTTPGVLDRTCGIDGGCDKEGINEEEVFLWGDAFVVKLNREGSGLLYSTFLGGRGGEGFGARGLAVDGDGNAFLAGETNADDFPTTPGAFDRTCSCNAGFDAANLSYAPDVIVTKLNSTGSALVYSTYLGGSGVDFQLDSAADLAIDGRGHAYVVGQTLSEDFPTTPDAFDRTLEESSSEPFVTKLSPNGSAVLFSSFLGETLPGSILGLDVDGADNVYVTGAGFNPRGDAQAFVAKLALGGGAVCGGRPATIVGTEANDVLVGTSGNDVIAGLGGNDGIQGLEGNDLVCGGRGRDTLEGGRGDDKLLGEAGWDRILGGDGLDNLRGGEGNDTLLGEAGDDFLGGDGGDDALNGGGGFDTCDTGAGEANTTSQCERF